MPLSAILIGILLILLGIVSYLMSAGESLTAFIPTAFGIVLAGLGLLARKEALRKHAMHAAAAVGLIALLGSASGFFKLFSLLAGEEVLRPGAVIAQSIMFVLSALFVGLAVNSFITARRNRQV
jgi:protein-S-isoprenylcysteine O-methyltransferase Ste14